MASHFRHRVWRPQSYCIPSCSSSRRPDFSPFTSQRIHRELFLGVSGVPLGAMPHGLHAKVTTHSRAIRLGLRARFPMLMDKVDEEPAAEAKPIATGLPMATKPGGATRLWRRARRQLPDTPLLPPKTLARTLHQVSLVFLGTGSMVPTRRRNLSSLALKLGGASWIFDCGEATQHQLQISSLVRKTSISRIFITHLHGDHVLGLPGMVTSLNGDGMDGRMVEIYGPVGTQDLLRVSMEVTRPVLQFNYRVYELAEPSDDEVALRNKPLYAPAELRGQPIFPDPDGTYRKLPSSNHDTENFLVHAAKLKHSSRVNCFGYVIQERNHVGNLSIDEILPTLLSPPVKSYLYETYGLMEPRKVFKRIRNGESVRISPDQVIHPHELLGANRKGRKICILGDTCDSRQIASMAAGCDVLVHESTGAYIENETNTNATDKSKLGVLRACVRRGHSNPEMAGAFATAIGCKKLVLTHFGAKFDRPPTRRGADRVVDAGSCDELDAELGDELVDELVDDIEVVEGDGDGDEPLVTEMFDHASSELSPSGVPQASSSTGGLTPEDVQKRSMPAVVAEQLLSLARETYTGDVVLARDFLEVVVPMQKGLTAPTSTFERDAIDASRSAARSAEKFNAMARGGYHATRQQVARNR